MLGEDLMMEGVGSVVEEVAGLDGVGADRGYFWDVGIFGYGLDLNGKGWGEGGVSTECVAEEDVVGLDGIRCE